MNCHFCLKPLIGEHAVNHAGIRFCDAECKWGDYRGDKKLRDKKMNEKKK